MRLLIVARLATTLKRAFNAYPLSHWHRIAFSSLSESAVRFASRIIRCPFSSVAAQSRLVGAKHFSARAIGAIGTCHGPPLGLPFRIHVSTWLPLYRSSSQIDTTYLKGGFLYTCRHFATLFRRQYAGKTPARAVFCFGLLRQIQICSPITVLDFSGFTRGTFFMDLFACCMGLRVHLLRFVHVQALSSIVPGHTSSTSWCVYHTRPFWF